MDDEDGTLTSDCPECGTPLLWGHMGWVPHTAAHHAARRRILLKAAVRQLRLEHGYRTEGCLAARYRASVLIVWQVRGGPRGTHYYRSECPGELWDDDAMGCQWLLAALGRSMRDGCEVLEGFRPHFMQVKYRVFDER
jgi:hypothetical protein